ncbi:MAG: hypothetical protein ACREJO_06700 [Phycisphaerales bacterium]
MKFAHIAAFAIVGTIGASVALSLQPAATPAQTAPATTSSVSSQPGNLKRVLEMFRSDLNASKIRTLNKVMKLTAPEADKFWPIYRKYEIDLAAVDDRKVALIRQFITANAGGSLTASTANEIADKWLKITQDRLDLWKKYHKEISSAVSPIRGAQFLQVEHQISLLVDINIASEMPLVDATAK